jgi:bifunctional UDP-N-acetylglucosamine pyrophosphorylase/glucosamine-1-phosphate N-acetyltransferase
MTKKEDATAVVLAAGEGKRMNSDRAKVLHPLAGKALLDHVLAACAAAGLPRAVVVIGHRREQVIEHLRSRPREGRLEVTWAVQDEQRGTGHALLCALPAIDQGGSPKEIVVLCGDAPLLRPRTLVDLLHVHRAGDAAATILTADLEDPTGYGRVIRGEQGEVERIVEHRDATRVERQVKEINSADYVFDLAAVRSALAEVTTANEQGEYYLTDTIAILKARKRIVLAFRADDAREVIGVNTVEQLAEAEAAFLALRAGGGEGP